MPRSWQSRMTQIRIECLKLLANTVSSSSTASRASGSRARAVGLVMRTCRGWKPTDVAHHPIPYDVGARFAPRPGLTFGSQYTGRALVVGSGFVHFRAFVVLALGVVLNCTGRRSATELRWCRWGLASKQCLLRAPNAI